MESSGPRCRSPRAATGREVSSTLGGIHDGAIPGGWAGERGRAVAVPSGTVTFLFTDIEGSTRLWQAAPEVPATLPPFIGFVLVNDLVVHETDVRAALGLRRAPASAARSFALAGYSFSPENRVRLLGLPALVLTCDGKQRRIGDGAVGAAPAADRHELVHVLAGRRTREQILALAREGDPAPFVDILSEYSPTTVIGID
jgi:class 3 adenylate cyclase